MDNKFQNGKIYKIITSNSNDVYIGSTIDTLKRRLNNHKCAYKNKTENCSSFIILKQGGYKIELIKDFPCNSRKELEREEGKYQREMDCVNQRIAGRVVKEYTKAHYQKHKEKFKIKNKKYQIDNEMKLKQKIDCECGGEYRYQSKWYHLKTKKHKRFLITKNGNGVIEQ